MFPNLNAEQARRGESNTTVAAMLGISRVTYEKRKREGKFTVSDANTLCDHYGCNYAYLFSEVPTPGYICGVGADE